MTKERVRELFLLFCDLDNIGPYMAIADNACEQVKKKLCTQVYTEEEGEGLHLYAAALAYYRYVLLSAGREAGDIALDGLSIRQNSLQQVEIARQVVCDFFAPVAYLLLSDRFYFLGVGG